MANGGRGSTGDQRVGVCGARLIVNTMGATVVPCQSNKSTEWQNYIITERSRYNTVCFQGVILTTDCLSVYSLHKRFRISLVSLLLACITVTSKWRRWRLKSPALWLSTQPFIQAQINENIKAPHHWPLWPMNSTHKGPVTRKMVPFEDVITWTHFSVGICIIGRTNVHVTSSLWPQQCTTMSAQHRCLCCL